MIPTVTATHTEPFHPSKAIAALDYANSGRAGFRVKVFDSSDAASTLRGILDLPHPADRYATVSEEPA